jgi:hypothetical protein
MESKETGYNKKTGNWPGSYARTRNQLIIQHEVDKKAGGS